MRNDRHQGRRKDIYYTSEFITGLSIIGIIICWVFMLIYNYFVS